MSGALRSLALLALAASAARAQATVVGSVYDSLKARAPLAGATVVIPELSRYATADAFGRFRFDTVPAGQYSLTFLHPLLDSLDISAEILPLKVPARGIVNTRLATPSPAALVWLICRAAADSSPALMIGHVRDAADSSTIADATISVSWSELVMGMNSLEQRTTRAEAHSRPSGSYVLCGVPNDLRLTVTASAGTHSMGPVTVTPVGDVFFRRDFLISRRDASRVTLSGTVRDPRGEPAAGVSVRILSANLEARSDDAGHFSIPGVPAGTHSMETRVVGWWPAITQVNVTDGESFRMDLPLGRRDPALTAVPAIRATATGTTGFDERRASGLGHFVTRGDIVSKVKIKTLANVLGLVPSLFVAGSRRLPVMKMAGRGGGDCTPNFYLNGFAWRALIPGHGQREVEEVLDVNDIVGIEVYAPSAVPPIFDRANRCGSIVIWTS